jgi:hypothetical protein
MQRVTYKTLVLLLTLLGLILVQQHTAKAMSIRPDAVWLAGDPNGPPEWIGADGPQMRLDTDDPNGPDQGEPEMALGIPSPSRLVDDPNEPSPPQPERV